MTAKQRAYQWLRQECEHCDSDHQQTKAVGPSDVLVLGRLDYLRGYVCPACDSSLDEMMQEPCNKAG